MRRGHKADVLHQGAWGCCGVICVLRGSKTGSEKRECRCNSAVQWERKKRRLASGRGSLFQGSVRCAGTRRLSAEAVWRARLESATLAAKGSTRFDSRPRTLLPMAGRLREFQPRGEPNRADNDDDGGRGGPAPKSGPLHRDADKPEHVKPARVNTRGRRRIYSLLHPTLPGARLCFLIEVYATVSWIVVGWLVTWRGVGVLSLNPPTRVTHSATQRCRKLKGPPFAFSPPTKLASEGNRGDHGADRVVERGRDKPVRLGAQVGHRVELADVGDVVLVLA